MNADSYRSSLKQLRDLIEDERVAILGNNAQRLSEITAAKSAALNSLSELLTAVQQGRAPAGVESARNEITGLLRHCMEQNRANGAMLHLRHARINSALGPLMNNDPVGYGPRMRRSAPLSRVLIRA